MNMFKNFISSSKKVICDTFDVNIPEQYKNTYEYDCDFDNVIKNYELKFEATHLENHNMASCELISVDTIKKSVNTIKIPNDETNNSNIDNQIHSIIKKRIIVVNLLNVPIPENITKYMGDTNFVIEHIFEIDMIKKYAIAISKNISHPNLIFNETIKITNNPTNNKINFDLVGSLTVNILIGINETIKKLWHMQYKSYYDSYNVV